RIGI
ncbi:hypothetical protein D030_1322B, partial [Vibrio parahaemolyticus AQ3810]